MFPELNRSHLLERFRSLGSHTMDMGCRMLDVLHVACALEIESDTFVSFDQRRQTLAKTAGLEVAPV